MGGNRTNNRQDISCQKELLTEKPTSCHAAVVLGVYEDAMYLFKMNNVAQVSSVLIGWVFAGLSVRKLLDLGVTMPRGPDELRWRFLCKMGFLRLVDF